MVTIARVRAAANRVSRVFMVGVLVECLCVCQSPRRRTCEEDMQGEGIFFGSSGESVGKERLTYEMARAGIFRIEIIWPTENV